MLRPSTARSARRMGGWLVLLLAGCMPLGYAYPTLSSVRPARVGPARDEVRAFRVDVADDDNCLDFEENDRYVLSALPLHHDGSFDPQRKVSVDYGWLWNCISVVYNGSTNHTIMVRLYRPGYRTLQLRIVAKRRTAAMDRGEVA